MVELRFFEIYRNSEYLLLLGQGIWVSFILTVCGFILHKILGGDLDAMSRKWLGQKLPPLPTL